MKNYNRPIYLFLSVSLILVVGSFVVLFYNFRKQTKIQNEVLKIENNLLYIDSLTTGLLQLETDKRGFQITGDANYLKNFNTEKISSFRNLVGLEKILIIKEDTDIILAIDTLLRLRIANLDSGIVVYTTKGFNASVDFMQRKGKKNIRELLNLKIGLLKNNLLTKLENNITYLNDRSKHNLSGLILLLLLFISLMLVAARTFRRAQHKIIRNHKRFQEAQRITKMGSWEWDIATNKIKWSQEQFRIFGEDRTSFELTYEGYLSHLAETEQQNTKALVQDALAGKSNYAVEHEIIRKDGTTAIVIEQGTVLFDDNNKPTGMFGTTQDITERKKIEEELHQTQKKTQAIFDNAADGIYQSTAAGKFIMANPAMAKMFGYDSPGEFISSLTDIGSQLYADPADRNRMADLLAKQDHIENFEAPLLTKNKEIVWVSESTRIVRDANGEISFFEGTLKDITEQKKAERELHVAREKFQSIFDNTADGIYQSTINGKFIIANPSMAKIFGYETSDDLIKSVTDIGSQLYADPVERKKMAQLILSNGHIKDYELQVLKKDKKIIWVSANIRMVKDEKGDISYFEGTLEDITERKKAEEQLLNLSDRLQLALRATSIGIWDWDVVKNSTVWDDEMFLIYGIDKNSCSNIPEAWESALHPDDIATVKEELNSALIGEKEFDSEFRVVWKDGSIHYIKGHAIVQLDESGKPIRMIGTNEDITERKVGEEEILQLNKSLDQFANITAHDLQEPIRMVSGFLGLLDKKYSNVLDDNGKSYVFRAKDGADRMSILIKDLLEFSRSGNKAAKKEPVDLAVVMDLVNKDLSIVVSDTGATLNIPTNLPTVIGTQSALYRLVLNLISNGIKFRKKDTAPEVTLSIEEQEDNWKFMLQDNGIGVAEKDQPKLFQAFQRLHRREEYPGTGLGLVTCKKIVETHGGKIWMTSEYGKGTAFHFTLPKNGIHN